MSIKRWNARRDRNEESIVKALRQVGALVIRISEKGAPDLLVLHRQRVILLEIKTKQGRATLAQEETSRQGWPVLTVRSIDDALWAIEPAL